MKGQSQESIIDVNNHYAFESGVVPSTPEHEDYVGRMLAETTDDMIRHELLNAAAANKCD